MLNRVLKSIGVLLLPVLLAGCLTTEYNLRAIYEDRNLSSADSTAIGVSFDDPVWVQKHVDQWTSAGVVIAPIDNTVEGRNVERWLTRLVSEGYEGAIVIEYDIDYLPTLWLSETEANFSAAIGDLPTELIFAGITNWETKTNADATSILFIDGASYFTFNPESVDDWVPYVGREMNAYSDSLLTRIGGDVESHPVYWLIKYPHDAWTPYTEYPTEATAANCDPLNLGKTINNYDATDLQGFRTYYDSLVKGLRDAGVNVVVQGDRVNNDTAKLTDRSVKGVWFPDTNPSNISTILSNVSTYRASYTPVNDMDPLLLIAGVRNDVYHETSSTVYATMINQLVNAGIYFTPGANDSYFDYPMYQPGDWWIRSDNDSNWQSKAPTYASLATQPRKLYALTYSSTVTQKQQYPLGGHTWSSAIGHDSQYWALGGDVSGVWTSMDGGLTWDNHNNGYVNDQDQPVHYGRDLISVKNSTFEGFVLANDRGIYTLATPFTEDTDWQPMIAHDDLNYLTYTVYSWSPWRDRLPFGSLAWDGNDLLAATAGKQRYDNDEYDSYYPWNVADGDSLHGANDYTEYTDNVGRKFSDGPFGKVGLWKYDFGEGTWYPVDGANGYKQEWGRYKDVDVAVVGSDTLYVVATSAGPKLYTATAGGGSWTDISGTENGVYSWGNGEAQPDQILPVFGTHVDTKVSYHLRSDNNLGNTHVWLIENISRHIPVTGTITIDGDNYAYNDAGSVGDFEIPLNGVTLTKDYAKGTVATFAVSQQAVWDVEIMSNGDIYCVLGNTDQNFDGSSGLYRLKYGEYTWLYCGGTNETARLPTADVAPLASDPLLTMEQVGTGFWSANPLSASYSIGGAVETLFSDCFVWASGYEGDTDDVFYVGGNASLSTWRVSVPRNGDANESTTELIMWRDFTTDAPRSHWPADLNVLHGGIPNAWPPTTLIHEVAVDPDDGTHIWATSGDYGWTSTNGGDSWTNNHSINSPTDSGFYKGTGYDETCIDGLAVLSDGRLIISRGDVYCSITSDETWEYIDRFTPNNEDYFESCTLNNDETLWGAEGGGLLSIQGWAGQNPTHDYIIYNNSDIQQQSTPGKLFLIHDDNQDGDFNDAGEWENISLGLAGANQYLYQYNHVTNGTDKIWISYAHFDGPLCEDGVLDGYGVLEYYWNGSTWEYNDVDQTTIAGWGARPADLYYDSNTNRLWMATRYSSLGGGLYVIDFDDGTPTWTGVFGTSHGQAPWNGSTYGDVQSITMDDGGNVLYFGTRGGSGKVGSLFRITNPSVAGLASFTIEQLLNTTGKPTHPTITETEYLQTRGANWNDAGEPAQRLCRISDVVVDPLDYNRVWFVQGYNLSYMATHQGLYAYDITNGEIVKVLDDEESWHAQGRGGVGLLYTEATDPPRFVWGTQCIGANWMEYNGLFPTGNYGEGEAPPIEMMGMSFGAPVFSEEEIAVALGDTTPVEPQPTAVEGAPIIDTVSGYNGTPPLTAINGSQFGTSMGTVKLTDNKFIEESVKEFESTPMYWSDGQIAVILNKGTFIDGNTAYIFVISSDGKVSLPYEIRIGE